VGKVSGVCRNKNLDKNLSPLYPRGERRFGLLPIVMRSQLGVGHGCNQYARSYRPPAIKGWRRGTGYRADAPEMSEERFAEIWNELQARGDKAKLMRLFGA